MLRYTLNFQPQQPCIGMFVNLFLLLSPIRKLTGKWAHYTTTCRNLTILTMSDMLMTYIHCSVWWKSWLLDLWSTTWTTREHWILCITFPAETNAADTHTHTQSNRRMTSETIPSPLAKQWQESTGYCALPSPPRLMQRTHTQRDSVTDERQATQNLLSLSGGEGNDSSYCIYLLKCLLKKEYKIRIKIWQV